MTRTHHRPIAGIIAAFGVIYFAWGVSYAFIGMAVAELPPLLITGGRFLVAGAILYAVQRLRGVPRPTLAQWRGPAVSGALMLVGGAGLVGWAQQTAPSSVAALMVATVPMWMVLFDWLGFKGPRPTPWIGAGIFAGFVGVYLISDIASTPGMAWGVVALCVAPVPWALGSLLSSRMVQPRSSLMTTSLQMFVGGFGLTAAGLFRGELGQIDTMPGPAAWLSVVYLILISSIIGYSAYGWLLRQVSPAAVSTYAFVNPVLALATGYFLLSEPFTGRMAGGAALVVLAVTLIVGQKLFARRASIRRLTPRPRRDLEKSA